ncbi:MAG: CRISPR-associated endonuclease Cas1 [Gaiellaceae bacterium]
MRYETSQPLRFTTLRGGVCVAEGYGLRVFVRHGQLHVCDGYGRSRRERIYSRVSPGIARVVILGHTGTISLEAMRWISELGIQLLHIDKDGRVLVTSTPTTEDARLRRAQALAGTSDSGVEIARLILRKKLNGQGLVLHQLPHRQEQLDAFTAATDALGRATSINELVMAERDAALTYWSAWAPVTPRFSQADARKLPTHWLRFGQRGSPLTSAPRLAVNPVNALLNYLYAILEAETRIACLAVGLDPSLGIVHADFRARDSFALDLMEAVRPNVDQYVLDLLNKRLFKAGDFYETNRGNCRLLSPTTHLLAETAPTWAQLIAPTAEEVSQALAEMPESRIERLATPLTNSNRLAARATVRRHPKREAKPTFPKLPPACRACGGEVPHPERAYCNTCLPAYERQQLETAFSGSGLAAIEKTKADGKDPTHGGKAAERRGNTNAQRKQQIAAWEREYGKLVDLTVFERTILPTIQNVPLSKLVRDTGLSLRYCSLIRRGERTPHPRHWPALQRAGR